MNDFPGAEFICIINIIFLHFLFKILISVLMIDIRINPQQPEIPLK